MKIIVYEKREVKMKWLEKDGKLCCVGNVEKRELMWGVVS
jgi:hypothetical protein